MSEYREKWPGELYISGDTRAESREAIEMGERQIRYQQIINIFKENGNKPLTDRQIARTLKEKGFIAHEDRNAAAPRVTELLQRTVLDEYGKAVDDVTGRKVRVVALAK